MENSDILILTIFLCALVFGGILISSGIQNNNACEREGYSSSGDSTNDRVLCYEYIGDNRIEHWVKK